MISKINILSFFVGSFLGVAQLVSKLILMNKYSSVSLIYGGFVAFFYIISSAIWIKILKSSISISSAYGFVILGFFIAITIYNYFFNTSINVRINDIVGIIFIFIGALLVQINNLSN